MTHHRASKYENLRAKSLTCGDLGLTSTEQRKLNATVDRVNLGYSPFDTTIHVPHRTAHRAHGMAVTLIFGRENYPIFSRHIDHSPN